MNQNHTPETQRSPYVLVNRFHPKPGMLDAFVELQVAEARRLGDEARALGWRGNRLFRTADRTAVIVVTVFDSIEAQRAWAASDAFAAHLELISPLLERVESVPCELVSAIGEI